MGVTQLGKLFGSGTRVKLLRLFLFNPGVAFDPDGAAVRIKSAPKEVRKEFPILLASGLLKRKRVAREVLVRTRRRKILKRKRFSGAVLHSAFPYTLSLQRLLISSALSGPELKKRVGKAGRIKLIVMAGLFLGEWDSRIDLLIVGDRIKMRRLDGIMRSVEAELGRELRYVVFSTPDFTYRMGINDRLVRDVFDYPHRVAFDRIGLN